MLHGTLGIKSEKVVKKDVITYKGPVRCQMATQDLLYLYNTNSVCVCVCVCLSVKAAKLLDRS